MGPLGRGFPYISRDIYLFFVQRMYGGHTRVSRPIYGKRCTTAEEAPCVSDSIYMETLSTLIRAIAAVVDKCYPNFVGYATIVGDMSADCALPAPLFTRLIWLKEHPGVKYTNSDYQQYEVIDIYLKNGLDWRSDKYITVTLSTPESGPTGP